MATVTGLTAPRMLEIEAGSIVDGEVIGGVLFLERHDGSQINAGSVTGPEGPEGPPGVGVPVGGADGTVLTKQSGTDYDVAWEAIPQPPIIDVVTAIPTSGLVEEMRVTHLHDDLETAGKVANDFVYLPSTDATRPWHHCGGNGWKRFLGDLNGSSTNTWTNEGTVFTAPLTGYYDIELTWHEANGPGESNGEISVGDSAGNRYLVASVLDTASARPWRVTQVYRQSIVKNTVVVIWVRCFDSGNPAHAFQTRCVIKPVRGSA